MQLVDGTPSDLDGITRKREMIAMHGTKQEFPWFNIFLGLGMFAVLLVFAIILLGKADLAAIGNALGGAGGAIAV